jgi:hypothetical protein
MTNNIYFGKVHSIKDEQKLYRIQVVIPGHTDKVENLDDLPYYFPFYGIHNLPQIDEIVPVIIFDGNFSMGFYGNVLVVPPDSVLKSENDEGDDYDNYLEIFKRLVGDNLVHLTYKPSTGIELINGESKLQIELEKYTMFVKANTITMVEDRIDIGNQGLERVIQGDKGVKELHDIMAHIQKLTDNLIAMFDAVANACSNPYTVPIMTAIKAQMPAKLQSLENELKQIDDAADKIQSEMVWTNE